MKKFLTILLSGVLLLLSACGAAKEADTTSDEYKARALAALNDSTTGIIADYSGKTAVEIYEFTTISSYITKASYYLTPAEPEEKVYTSLNSYESRSSYEITDDVSEMTASITNDEAWYLEFMIAYTTNESDALAANRFKTAELEGSFDRSTVKVDRDFEYDTIKLDYMTELDSINNIAIKRNGQTFTLYLNGGAVKTLSLTKDIKKAYLMSYKYYIARVNEIVD